METRTPRLLNAFRTLQSVPNIKRFLQIDPIQALIVTVSQHRGAIQVVGYRRIQLVHFARDQT